MRYGCRWALCGHLTRDPFTNSMQRKRNGAVLWKTASETPGQRYRLSLKLCAVPYLLRLYGLPLIPGRIGQGAAIFIDSTLQVLDFVPGCVHRMVVDFILFHYLPPHLYSGRLVLTIGNDGCTEKRPKGMRSQVWCYPPPHRCQSPRVLRRCLHSFFLCNSSLCDWLVLRCGLASA